MLEQIYRRSLGRTLIALAAVAAFGACSKADADKPKPRPKHVETAIFAGGCFWCMQPPFDKLDGVVSTTVGYAGGKEKDPSYRQVASGTTGHAESIKVEYDPRRVSYAKLLDVFWRNIDPTDRGGQFVDRGRQYRPAIFYLDAKQKRIAKASRAALAKSGRFKKPVVVEITRATPFYPAEKYHQKFYKKNPTRYYGYRAGSGRDRFLRRVWGK